MSSPDPEGFPDWCGEERRQLGRKLFSASARDDPTLDQPTSQTTLCVADNVYGDEQPNELRMIIGAGFLVLVQQSFANGGDNTIRLASLTLM